MSTKQINEELAFLRKYVRKLAVVDETTAQRLTTTNKTKRGVIIGILSLISEYGALLG